MFGFVQANPDELNTEQKQRYRSYYCGICHSLGENHGFAAKLGLTYDMTFLAILLSSLYEPSESEHSARCVVHPIKEHGYIKNEFVDYAADMTVALVYFKCLDDWKDDRDIKGKAYSALLASSYKKVREKYPRQCGIIEKELAVLTEIENNNEPNPDAAANSFGRLMADLFVVKDDIWNGYLAQLGYNLGRYIYLADAAIDLEDDIRKGRYNPFKNITTNAENLQDTLQLVLGFVSQNFETLPLVQDIEILRNIIYSGIWSEYNRHLDRKKEKHNGQRTT